MAIHGLAFGLTKRNDFTATDEEVDRNAWDAPDLPDRPAFERAVREMFERVELPWFPATAWIEVYTPFQSLRGEVREGIAEPETVAIRLWAFALAAGEGFG